MTLIRRIKKCLPNEAFFFIELLNDKKKKCFIYKVKALLHCHRTHPSDDARFHPVDEIFSRKARKKTFIENGVKTKSVDA